MLSSPRMVTALKAVIAVCAVGLIVLAGLFVRFVISGGLGDNAPRSEIERGVFAAEEAVQANPKDPIARVRLAAAYLERKSPRLAEEQAQLAIRLAPKDPSGYYVLGLAQTALNQNDAAIVSLEKASNTKGQQAPFYQDSFTALARAYERAGDQKKAMSRSPRPSTSTLRTRCCCSSAGSTSSARRTGRWRSTTTAGRSPTHPTTSRRAIASTRSRRTHPKELKEVQKSITAQTQGLQPAAARPRPRPAPSSNQQD